MWLFTSKGFLSIVAHRDEPDMLLVRSRESGVIAELFPGQTEIVTPNADYRYRCKIKRSLVAETLFTLTESIDYDNFKNSIPTEKKDYHRACMDVWNVMYGLQSRS